MAFRSLNRLALVAALALGWVVMAGAARAQAPSPGALAAAKELVALKGGGAMFDPLIPGVIESAKNQLVPTNPQLIKPLDEVAAQLHKEYASKRVELLDLTAQIYAKHFTEAELKDIVAFYKTPAGKKMLGLPDAWVPVAPIIVGYPSAPPATVARKTPEVRWVS